MSKKKKNDDDKKTFQDWGKLSQWFGTCFRIAHYILFIPFFKKTDQYNNYEAQIVTIKLSIKVNIKNIK